MKMMNDSMNPCVGAVFSADIAVPEHEREQRFYGRLLRTGTMPLWRDDLTAAVVGIRCGGGMVAARHPPSAQCTHSPTPTDRR